MKIHIAIVAVVIALGSTPVAAQSLTPTTGQTPSIHLDVSGAKPCQTLAFTATGFGPNETVDVWLGDQSLTTTTADSEERIMHASIGLPVLGAGDYTLNFVGRASQIPVASRLSELDVDRAADAGHGRQ